ncbi:hypothetical protein NKH77_10755 [Streptomyces sp. M19]
MLADLNVFLADSEAEAVARRNRLDERAGREFDSDAATFTGTPAALADLLEEWSVDGAPTGSGSVPARSRTTCPRWWRRWCRSCGGAG